MNANDDRLFKGLGLIGRSLAQAIKLAHPDVTILASDPAPTTIPYARQQGWLDAGVSEFERVAEADFIFLASPVDQIVADLKTLATRPLKPGVIVTDVGSTKQAILTAGRPGRPENHLYRDTRWRGRTKAGLPLAGPTL